MFQEMLLMSGWTLQADELPERMETARSAGFTLPGASSLKAFSDLLGTDEDEQEEQPETKEARFSLPGMLPPGTRGSATLSHEIDFARLAGTQAVLEIDHLCGTGAIYLGEKKLLSFSGGMPAAADVTNALRLRRKQTLSIAFDDAQQAGIFGTALVHTADGACIETVRLAPDEARQTLGVEAVIHAQRPGAYALRAAIAGTQEDESAPWRETCVQMEHDASQALRFSLSMRAPRFEAGRPYQPPVLKLCLLLKPQKGKGPGMPVDARTIMTGYPCKAPGAYVPLTEEDCAGEPDALIASAKSLHLRTLSVPEKTGSLLFRRAALEGVCLLVDTPHDAPALKSPCAVKHADSRKMTAVSRAAACWQLCGMPAMPPMPAHSTTELSPHQGI